MNFGVNGYEMVRRSMKNKLVIIFVRNPELGKVKTRLAMTIGEAQALSIYKLLLDHTERVVRDVDCDKALFYSDTIMIMIYGIQPYTKNTFRMARTWGSACTALLRMHSRTIIRKPSLLEVIFTI